MIQWDYHTPDAFQNLRMCSDGTVLTGLWFVDSPDEKKPQESGSTCLFFRKPNAG
ncbi:MAG: hypothetical protein ACLS6W_07565 [Ruminococcus sp.]